MRQLNWDANKNVTFFQRYIMFRADYKYRHIYIYRYIHMAWFSGCILTNSFWFIRRPPYYGLSRSLREAKGTYIYRPKKYRFHCHSCEGSGWSVTPCKSPTFSLPVNTSKQIIRRKKTFSSPGVQSGQQKSASSFFLVQPNQPNQSIHQPNQSSQLHPISSTFPPGRWTPKSEPPAAVPETPPAPRSKWSKQTWILEGKNGRNRPEQVGMMWKNCVSMKGFSIVKLEGRLVIPKIFSSQGYWICPFSVACQWGIWTWSSFDAYSLNPPLFGEPVLPRSLGHQMSLSIAATLILCLRIQYEPTGHFCIDEKYLPPILASYVNSHCSTKFSIQLRCHRHEAGGDGVTTNSGNL